MFGLDHVSWSEFLLFNLAFCVLVELVLFLLLYFASRTKEGESTHAIRKRRAQAVESVQDENLPN